MEKTAEKISEKQDERDWVLKSIIDWEQAIGILNAQLATNGEIEALV